MEDERAAPSSAFALRLVSDLLTGLVLNGGLTKGLATVLVDEALAELLSTQPEYDRQFREIAATLTTQIGMAVVDLEAQNRKKDDQS
jgi:predicted acylesterase/phospholipase RssA